MVEHRNRQAPLKLSVVPLEPSVYQKDYFPRIGSFHGSPSDDGDHDNQNRLEQICFFEERGLFEHKKTLCKFC